MSISNSGKQIVMLKEKPNFIKKTQKREANNLLLAKSMTIGYYLITPLLLGVFVGLAIDRFLGSSPLFVLVFIIFGLVGTFYNLYKLFKESSSS